jgi:hypothetical protein
MKVLFTVIVCLASAVLAAADRSTEITDRAKGAHAVVVATVSDVRSRFGTNAFGDQLIVSDLLVEVSETWKGSSPMLTTITVEGGQVGDLTLRVSDLPAMRPGDRVAFFLERTSAGALVPHGRGRGMLKLDAADRVAGTELTLSELRKLVEAAKP